MQLNDLLLPGMLFTFIKNNINEKKRKPLMHESRTQHLGLKIGIVTTTLLQALAQKLNKACEAPQLVQFLTEAEVVYVEAIGMNSVYSVESFCAHTADLLVNEQLICSRIVVSDITGAREFRRESWLQAGHTDSPWEADLKA